MRYVKTYIYRFQFGKFLIHFVFGIPGHSDVQIPAEYCFVNLSRNMSAACRPDASQIAEYQVSVFRFRDDLIQRDFHDGIPLSAQSSSVFKSCRQYGSIQSPSPGKILFASGMMTRKTLRPVSSYSSKRTSQSS